MAPGDERGRERREAQTRRKGKAGGCFERRKGKKGEEGLIIRVRSEEEGGGRGMEKREEGSR